MGKVKSLLTTLMGMAGFAIDGQPQRGAVKCALPNCNKMTKHRGGYCCAEHKTLHWGK